MYVLKFILTCVAFIALRMATLFVLNIAIWFAYLTANSKSMYMKMKLEVKQSSQVRWITRLCFWSAKSREQSRMRFLIVWRLIAMALLIPLVVTFPAFAHSGHLATAAERLIQRFSYYFDIITIYLTCVQICYSQAVGKKRKQRKK